MASLNTALVLACLILRSCLVQCDQKKPKVIIVGAGAAGIAAGCRLMQNGIYDVTVLEAENRIGGRIHSVDFAGDVVELGAATLDLDDDNPVLGIANSTSYVKLTDFNLTASEFVEANGHSVPVDISNNIQGIIDDIYADYDSMDNFKLSIAKFVNESIVLSEDAQAIDDELREKYLSWYSKIQMSVFGVKSLHLLPAKEYSQYSKENSFQLWVFERPGMKSLLDALMNKFSTTNKPYPLEEKILFNKEVTNINWSNGTKFNVIVTCSDGSKYEADHLILTVSLGVLKERVNTLFTPDLPAEKKKAIRYLGYGENEMVFLKFSKKWWAQSSEGFSFLWSKNYTNDLIGQFGNKYESKQWLSSLLGLYPIDFYDTILEVSFSGKDTKHINTLTDDEIKDGIMDAIRMFLGSNYNISEPVGFIRSHWSSNPHFCGIHSYVKTDTIRHKTGPSHLAKSLYNDRTQPVVIFSGEATHPKHYASVHGAIQSGWIAADEVLELYD